MSNAKNEKGGVLVFMTLMIVLLLIMVGMGLDTGYLTYTRSQGQAAVDAAALSAVSGLPLAVSGLPLDEAAAAVSARAAAFNSANDYTGSAASAPIGASNITYVQYTESKDKIDNLPSITGANGVRVALEKTNPYTETTSDTQIKTPAFLTPLMKLFGASASGSNNINVSAVAALKALPGIPIAVMENVCNVSGVVTLVERGVMANSCWTTYTEPSNIIAALFERSLTCSRLPAGSGLVTIGTQIQLDNDEEANVYEAAKELFITQKPIHLNSWWIVPVIPNSASCTRPNDQITQWAKIKPSEVNLSSQYIKAEVVCGQELFRASDNICFTPRLLRDTKSGM